LFPVLVCLYNEEALSRLHFTITRAYKVNPDIIFEVFIHKVDRLSDDTKF
jgi:Ras-related GTP-binding protein C/D